ncbi:MAG: RNB domain-containing ribonuclease [Proteobacteria bacterium]|nr:RNB domain-containing ribonuclease [Pseudomonadota bacterium]MDE3208221.1 RNB domain-containing ribonuclease [Pseudomonadota bacterium]
MNILFEEDGIKAAKILADNNTSLQIELPHGKRSKIKSSQVLLRFELPDPGMLLDKAQSLSQSIDPYFLWECADPEFDFLSLAQDYLGKPADPVTACAILMTLYKAPTHFYKKGHGKFKTATPEALQSALASQERRRLLDLTIQNYTEQLISGQLPPEFEAQLKKLMFAPDKTSPETKAIDQASQLLGMTATDLFRHCGAIPSEYQWHLNQFLWEYFPGGVDHTHEVIDLDLDLPASTVSAFSIDDASTTEVDDAFSVLNLENDKWQIGVHIAVPALMPPGCLWEATARKRLSTVYLPGDKITMLPPEAVALFSLEEGTTRPALSLYFDFAADGSITKTRSELNFIHILANLHIETLDPLFETNDNNLFSHPFGPDLNILNQITLKLEAARNPSGKQTQFIDYNFYVNHDRINIIRRQRGTPIDRIVSELMILANTTWAGMLAKAQVAGIFRGQKNGKVKMTTHASPHQGLGVNHYIWATSPLRRYADFYNQRQLLSLAGYQNPSSSENPEELYSLLHDFEQTYDAYAQFQRKMEKYWCLRYLLQENLHQVQGTVIKEGLIRLDNLPLVLKVPGTGETLVGQPVCLSIGQIDLLELTVQTHLI